MPSREQALAAMRDYLTLADPEWDVSPGTAEYKILEAVAQQVENLSYNAALRDYHFDVDKKVGLQLEAFMSLFGFSRIKARRAVGEVTFLRATPAPQDYVIPIGTQVFVPATSLSPSLFFQTTVTTFLAQGTTEVSIPVQAVVAGSTGNVSAGAITGLGSSIAGVSAVTNQRATSGGRDAESDGALRNRWRQTVFRNLAGTEDQFVALALNESAFVSRATVVGPVERYSEQIQLIAPQDLATTEPWESLIEGDIGPSASSFSVLAGTGTRFPATSAGPFYVAIYDQNGRNPLEVVRVSSRSGDVFTVDRAASPVNPPAFAVVRQVFPSSVPDSAYAYPPGGEVVGRDLALATQEVARPTQDYELVLGVPTPEGVALPALRVTKGGAAKFGLDSILEFEHEYTPASSRNDPAARVAEKIDLFIDGRDPLVVSEQFSMRYDQVFGETVAASSFRRDDGITSPQAGNVFTRLSKAPISAIPETFSVAASLDYPATSFVKDQDYWLVTDVSTLEGSPRSINGIEWRIPGNAPVASPVATGVTGAGKLDGWFAYCFTFVVDGRETLASEAVTSGSENDGETLGKNSVTVPTYDGPGGVVWRRLYRSDAAPDEEVALKGPFYLVRTIKDNTTTTVLDGGLPSQFVLPPATPPAADAQINIEYAYNALVERLDAQVDLVRLVGTDTLVHEADDVRLKFNLAVVLVPGISISDVRAGVTDALAAWVARKSFRNNVQVADVIDVVSSVPGVDNVRLARLAEARNDTQRLTIAYPQVPNENRDAYRLIVGRDATPLIPYNESASGVREALETLPTIEEGNSYATQLVGGVNSSATSIVVQNNAGILTQAPYYVQIDGEIMEVTAVGAPSGGNRTLTVIRGRLFSSIEAHVQNSDVHILGDVAVTRAGGPSNTFQYTITFLANAYTGVNNWGLRSVDPLEVELGPESQLDFRVDKRSEGAGYGIQRIAMNGRTIVKSYEQDFYLNSDELPSLFGVDVVSKAPNTF